MTTIYGTAALTIFQVAFVQKFIYLFPLPLLVSDIEYDGWTDLPIMRICLFVYIFIT